MTKRGLAKFLRTGESQFIRNDIRRSNANELDKDDWRRFYAKSGEICREFFSTHDSGDLCQAILWATASNGFGRDASAFIEVYCGDEPQAFFEKVPGYFTKRDGTENSGFYRTSFGELRNDAEAIYLAHREGTKTEEQLKSQFRILSFCEIDEFDCPVVWHFEIATAAATDAAATRLLDVLEQGIANFLRPLPYWSASYE